MQSSVVMLDYKPRWRASRQIKTLTRNNFEAAATHLLPYDSVQRKRSDHAGGKRGAADISDVTHDEADISAFGAKKGIGKTGVHLRYQPLSE
jgi:hypothetical protein